MNDPQTALREAEHASAMKVAQLGVAWDVAVQARTASRNASRAALEAWKSENGEDYYTPMTPEESDPTVEKLMAEAREAHGAVTAARRRLRNAIRVHRQIAPPTPQESAR